MHQAEFNDLARCLQDAERVVLTTHITPDGDGLGSALALMRQLRRMGKTAIVVNCSTTPHDLRWLYTKADFRVFNGQREQDLLTAADVIVATDIGGSSRLGTMRDPVAAASATKVVIDHHVYENDIFDIALIDPKASSSAEITFHVLEHLNADLDEELATPLYVGLTSDTGNFSYSATSPKCHQMAARLLEAGVEPQVVWRNMACQIPMSKMKCLGLLLARLNPEQNGKLVWTSVDREFLSRNETQARDAFEVVNYMLRVKDVEAGVFFMEVHKKATKVSLRSAGTLDVCTLAQQFGGGGHRFAAGCTVPLGLREAEGKVLGMLRKAMAEVFPDIEKVNQ